MTGITPNNRVIPVIFVFYCIILKIFLLDKTLIYQALWRMAYVKREISDWEVITMMTELTTETELRFNVKTISTEDMISMLEDLGWKEN